jgi:hypothetical protein
MGLMTVPVPWAMAQTARAGEMLPLDLAGVACVDTPSMVGSLPLTILTQELAFLSTEMLLFVSLQG